MTVYEPCANFVFCRLPDSAPSGPEVAKRLFVRDKLLVKHCAGKSMAEGERYLRIASRTVPENKHLVASLRTGLET
jgi:histidinol-phosphate/aromatic aminotransferase/cobyric acid decarboxylase-like protein